MFLIRTVFWLGVVFMLLPGGQAGEPLVPAVRAVGHDLRTFCQRHDATCPTRREVWGLMQRKAAAGARMFKELTRSEPDGQGLPTNDQGTYN